LKHPIAGKVHRTHRILYTKSELMFGGTSFQSKLLYRGLVSSRQQVWIPRVWLVLFYQKALVHNAAFITFYLRYLQLQKLNSIPPIDSHHTLCPLMSYLTSDWKPNNKPGHRWRLQTLVLFALRTPSSPVFEPGPWATRMTERWFG